MTIEAQIKLNDAISGHKTTEVVSSFLREWAGLPAAPAMENDHAGSLYEATPAPSSDEVRRGIQAFARLMS